MMKEVHLTEPKPVRTRPGLDILGIASIALVYFLVARFSLTLIFEPEGIAAIWPPSGIFLSAVLLTRKNIRPYLVGALFLTDLAAEILAGIPPVVSLVYSAVLAGDAALSAWLLLRFVGEPITFRRVRDVVGFLLLSVLLSNALASIAAALVVKAYLGAPLWSSWFWWWSSDGVGNLLVTPLTMSLAYSIKNHFKNIKVNQLIEGAVLILLMVSLNTYAFSHFPGDNRLALLLNVFAFPFLIWASLRLGVIGAASTAFIMAIIILWKTATGQFPLWGTVPNLTMIILVQIYLATLSVSSLFLASLIIERKQTEDALQESEDKFKYFFDHSVVGKSITQTSGEIHVNRSFCEMLGYSPEILQNKRWQDITHPDDIELTQREVDAILAGEKEAARFNKRYLHKNGAVVWADISTSLRRDRQGKPLYLMTTVVDITAHKQVEEKLHEDEARLRLAMDAARGGAWEWDLQTNENIWSEELWKVYGLEPHSCEPSFEAWLQTIHPDDREGAAQAVQQAAREATALNAEWRVRDRDGTERWLMSRGQPIFNTDGQAVRYIGTVLDITDRKQMEDELRKAHDELELQVQQRTAALSQANMLLQTLLDNMPDYIYFKDTESRFIKNSRSHASSLGLSDPSQMVGKTDFDYFPHAPRAYAAEQEIMRSGQPLVDFEEWVVWPDGHGTWVSTTKAPLRDHEDKIIGTFGISRDITDRKRNEEALQKARDELEAFSYSVSHDLRAPLRGIDGWSMALLEDYGSLLDEHGQEYIKRVRSETQHMGELIDDLLQLSRITRSEMSTERVDLSAIARTIAARLQESEPGRQVEFTIQNGLSAQGDAHLLEVALNNLLDNAFKFTGKTPNPRISFGQIEVKGEHIFFVRDNGVGFDMAFAKKLFGAFQRMHKTAEFPGTGIGLTTVQRIIHRHGGRIWAEAAVDEGATFLFTLREGL